MPWRIALKSRVSTVAGFEGGTKVHLNTIDPMTLRDRIVPRLYALRGEGRLAGGCASGPECSGALNLLRYHTTRLRGSRSGAAAPGNGR